MYFLQIDPPLRLSSIDRIFEPMLFFLSEFPFRCVTAHSYEQRTQKHGLPTQGIFNVFKKMYGAWNFTFYFQMNFECTRANGTCLRKCKVILIRIRIRSFDLMLILFLLKYICLVIPTHR